MTVPLLVFDHIRFGYTPRAPAVLPDLYLEIQSGSVTAILGPNGAGKTTLLHLILGWLKPQSGVIYLDGKPLQDFARNELGRRMGLVPQSEAVAFDYTLLDFALFGRTPYLRPLEMPGPEDFDIAQKSLERIGLGSLSHRPITSLSGGERQLGLIARALAQQPRLLLLDEPTSHLDLSNKARLIQLLKRLNGEGVTVLFTTHEPEVASAFATHLILMREGQVQQVGALPEVLTSTNLSALYGLPVDVVEAKDRRLVVWS
jgi:iron complex transport system ATP-binding protein